MHISTLFSNLLVVAQIISLPSLIHGRFLFEDSAAHPFEKRQTCAARTCNELVQARISQANIFMDHELQGALEFLWIAVDGNGVGIQIENGLGVIVHATIRAFNNEFYQIAEIGIHGLTLVLQGARWLNWHNQMVSVQLTYRAGVPVNKGQPQPPKPKKAGGKRDLLGEGMDVQFLKRE